MSKARVVILSVVVEGRSQAGTARIYGVSSNYATNSTAEARLGGATSC
ncbi:MAG: hypothetical protein GY788_12940 [bacterium]|nr:hypothetical protein [bacterium]